MLFSDHEEQKIGDFAMLMFNIEALKKKHNNEVFDLQCQFAKKHNKIRLGFIVTDNTNTIIVEKMQMLLDYNGMPYVKYLGPMLKKNGDKYKDNRIGTMTQLSVVSYVNNP